MKKILFVVVAGAIFFAQQVRSQDTCFRCADATPGTIWCDDFEDGIALSQKYFEYNNNGGKFIPVAGVGRDGSMGMRVSFAAGQVSAGGLSKSFGRTPDSYIGNHAANPTITYSEIYWRMDVRLQPGWTGGGGDKLSRALCLANSNWAEGLMAHLWSGGTNSNYLLMDPATGIDVSGNLVSTTYNDFPNLRWLGAKAGNIDMFSTANSGRWFCVEGHAKLNTPATTGPYNGVMEFRINDTLQAGSYNLNWHGNYNSNANNMGINAVFFENYWNAGSPVQQERYFDNIVISTQRIGCACATSTAVSDKKDFLKDVTLAPVPATSFLEIHLPVSENISFSIYDLVGKEIMSGFFSGKRVFAINTSGLETGIYLLKLEYHGGWAVRKFSVQR